MATYCVKDMRDDEEETDKDETYKYVLLQHKADKDRLEQAIREAATLKKIVLKLRGQLKVLERVDLERQQSAVKVKAGKAEIAEKVCDVKILKSAMKYSTKHVTHLYYNSP